MSKTKRKRNSLSAKLVSWWHPTLNGDLRPKDVSCWSYQVVWFLHYDKKWKQWHEWDSTPNTMNRGENCPICTGKRLVVGINDLVTRNPTVAAMWHPTLNGELTAQMVTEHSGETRWWAGQHKDKKTGILHEWPMRVSDLTKKNPNTCSVCSGHRVQIGVNDLASQYPYLAKEWDYIKNKNLTPQMVTGGSQRKVFWKHKSKAGLRHGWPATPNSRTGVKARGCSECAPHGFDLALPAYLYVLCATIKDTQVLQFGISHNILARLSTHSRSGFVNPPVRLMYFNKGSNARALEVLLLNLLKDHHVPTATQRGIKFEGSTEAFCLEDADEEFLEDFGELAGLEKKHSTSRLYK